MCDHQIVAKHAVADQEHRKRDPKPRGRAPDALLAAKKADQSDHVQDKKDGNEENEERIAAFLEANPDFEEVGRKASVPFLTGRDGAFACALRRK